MTWKDLWTEFLLKFGIKVNKKPRKLKIQRHDINEFMTTANIIKVRNETEFENRLNRRSTTTSYLRTDDRLFEPYVDLIATTTIGRENFSFAKEIGSSILRTAKKFEQDNPTVFINKSHLYFGLSLNSIYLNDTINAMIYWELSQQEESNVVGAAAFNPSVAINNTLNKFSSVINPITLSIKDNPVISILRTNRSFIEDFSELVKKQNSPEIFAYFSSALRYRQVDYWLRNDFTEMTKMYSQELVNSLCILCEASFKDLGATGTLGNILNNNLATLNANVSAIVGHSRNGASAATGLFLTYPTSSDTEFNTNFPTLVNVIKANTQTDDETKAYLIYGAYMLRNKSLHDFNPTLTYYNNKNLFLDTIGLLFCSVASIKNL